MIQVGALSFQNIEELRNHVQSVLNRTPLGQKVRAQEDLVFLKNLIQKHPSYQAATEIRSIRLTQNKRRKITELELTQEDAQGAEKMSLVRWTDCLLEN